MKILKKILSDKTSEVCLMIISRFTESNIFQNFGDLYKKTVLIPPENTTQRTNFLLESINIMNVMIDLFKSRLDQFPVMELCFNAQIHLTKILQQDAREQFQKAFNNLQQKYTVLITDKAQKIEEEKKEQQKPKPKVIKVDESYKELPRDDFKEIDIIPGEKQLREKIAFFRRMPEEGDLINVHNYLDILFRLLYEDAVQDLRNGVLLMGNSQLKKLSKKDFKQQIKDTNIKHHESLTIDGLEVVDGSAIIQFRLPTNKKQFVDWRISKKLLNGSLVILSHDNFKSLVVGLIKNREAKEMNETHKKFGYVPINIEIIKSQEKKQGAYEFFHQYSMCKFDMIESSAYFEAYQHVLRSLQEMDKWTYGLPFERYFVKGKSNVQTPGYMQEILYQHHHEIQREVLSLKLDQSQFSALNEALRKDLALIQGPPGTGKTFIGVQLVKILLKYEKYWSYIGPILLVTYTNHALDQFLNHIKKFTDKIVRIGGRCQDEELEEFQFQTKIKNEKGNQQLYKTYRQLDNVRDSIKQCKVQLYSYQFGFIHSKIEDQIIMNLIHKLKMQFPDYLRLFLPDKNKDNLMSIYIQDQIKNLLQETKQNIIVIFWLGIIDLKLYVDSLIEQYKELEKSNKQLNFKERIQQIAKEQQQNQENNEVGDDQDYDDEREKDYVNQRVQYNANLETIRDKINEQYQPEQANQNFFQGVQTIQDCIFIGSQIIFQEGENAKRILQKTLQNKYFMQTSIDNRWKINNYLLGKLNSDDAKELSDLIQKYSILYKHKEELQAQRAQNLLETSHIIALTTTGRAKNYELLKKIQFPIIIVEEAAEVFEAHIVTSLSQQTQHLILIGDHEQLKPNPSVYELSLKYNLSMSMFERLIHNKIPHSTLSIQRRMRPQIAKIMNFIYPELQSFEDVYKYPNIRGLQTNLFFYDHNYQENTQELIQSKQNTKEAEIIVRFTWYLIQQNYKPSQITILTLYSGQLLLIKSMTKNNPLYKDIFKNIKVTNVDNYQGKENDIIILSLVRSNPTNQIGFLKISNRVCVALSRARQGLYIFGSSKSLIGSKFQLWIDVIEYLKANSYFGDSLKFKCLNHGIIAQVKTIEDFMRVPEGGCSQLCNLRMECGHGCESLCHPIVKTSRDPTGHGNVKCVKTCQREMKCGHSCKYKCFECKKGHKECFEKKDKYMGRCGHTISVQCYQFEKAMNCTAECEKVLECGHQCKSRCYQKCGPCKEEVQWELQCGHLIKSDCSAMPSQADCYHTCGILLDCGHKCKQKCSDCYKNGDHSCKQKCNRKLICRHSCTYPCTKNCPPCVNQDCETKCIHSKCPRPCQDVCLLCKEPCENKCQHSRCKKLCSEPCNRPPCKLPCKEILSCKHQCIGLCGDKCPKLCRQCKPDDETFQVFFGHEADPESRFIQIDCGHIFEVVAMDHYMTLDPNENQPIQYKCCPKCKKLIMTCTRYMNQINQVLNDVNNIKKIKNRNELLFNEAIRKLEHEININIRHKILQLDTKIKPFIYLQKLIDQIQKQLKISQNSRSIDGVKAVDQKIVFIHDLINLALVLIKYSIHISSAQQLEIQTLLTGCLNFNNQTQKLASLLANQYRKRFLFANQQPAIIEEISLPMGNWIKCPQMHYFVTDECGDGLQEAKCPYCKAIPKQINQYQAVAEGGNQADESKEQNPNPRILFNPQDYLFM